MNTDAINTTQRLRRLLDANPDQTRFDVPRIVLQMLVQDSEMLAQERAAPTGEPS